MVIKYKNVYVQKENFNNFQIAYHSEIFEKQHFRNSLFNDLKKISVKSG